MKYIFLNDVYHILKKRKKLLYLYFIAIVFVSIVYASAGENSQHTLSIILGNNFKNYESLYIELIMFIFNIAISLYICFSLYIKDIRYQLDNIFLRISPSKWILKKNIIFLFIMLVFKVIEYFCIITIFLIFNLQISYKYIMYIILKDYLYHVLLQYISLIIYILFGILKKLKKTFIILIMIIIFFYPKNILNCYTNILFIAIIITLIFTEILFKYKSKTIIQKVGKI